VFLSEVIEAHTAGTPRPGLLGTRVGLTSLFSSVRYSSLLA